MSRTTRHRGYHHWLCEGQEVGYIVREMNHQLYRRIQQARYPRFTWYDKYIMTDEETLAKAKEEYAQWARDGRHGLTKTTHNTGFKTDAKKTVRRANKSFCRAVLSGDDYENIVLPTVKLGKLHIWNWW